MAKHDVVELLHQQIDELGEQAKRREKRIAQLTALVHMYEKELWVKHDAPVIIHRCREDVGL